MVAEALRAAGFRVGLYTSPHLVDVRERMLVDGRPIPPAAFAQWTECLRSEIEASNASFFEATTAIALADCAARGAEIVVAEVGLGGRLDATNVLQPLVSAVTTVAMDHADFLGDSLEQVAFEKAGIAKPGVPFVAGEADPAVATLLQNAARDRGAEVIAVPPEARYAGALAAAGPHQRRNALVARYVLRALPDAWRPAEAALRVGVGRARLPGRLDRRGKWLFDVAHNPAGMATLVQALREWALPSPVHALVGVLGDKDWSAMVRALETAVQATWATVPPSAPSERRWDLAAVAERFPQVTVEADFDVALRNVQQGARTVVVAGSFHTVGDALTRLPGFAPLR
jgi:dihydrofolate synthase/folylpolyglutamate synthase